MSRMILKDQKIYNLHYDDVRGDVLRGDVLRFKYIMYLVLEEKRRDIVLGYPWCAVPDFK